MNWLTSVYLKGSSMCICTSCAMWSHWVGGWVCLAFAVWVKPTWSDSEPCVPRWNFTVAHVFLSMVEGELGEEEKDVSCQVEDFSNWTVHTDASQDLLYVTNRSVISADKNIKCFFDEKWVQLVVLIKVLDEGLGNPTQCSYSAWPLCQIIATWVTDSVVFKHLCL